MASLERRNSTYRVVFMHAGRKHGFSLDTGDKQTAEALCGGVEKTLMLMGQGIVRMPEGADLVSFVRSGGKVEEPVQPAQPATTFATFRDRYLEAHRNGAMETNSLATVEMHLRHIADTLGEKFAIGRLTLSDLQRHVDRRLGKKYRGRRLSPYTVRKEISSLRAAWNWATPHGIVNGLFPSKGIVYPKTDEKPPFMTLQEVQQKIALGVSTTEAAELWESLYLRKEEIEELLSHVKATASHPWIYPLCCAAAYTGARRSELLRAEITDLDFTAEALLIREKKRSRRQRTTRQVALTPFLMSVFREWLAVHPGGRFLFCQTGTIARSKKRSLTTGHKGEKTRATSLKGRTTGVRIRQKLETAPVTKDEAHDHLRRTLAGSKWECIRGYHIFRHSFISCLATAKVDQRILDDFVGHRTEEQRRRYRHLYPDAKQKAIAEAFC